jgi:serine O-acetyltransferase
MNIPAFPGSNTAAISILPNNLPPALPGLWDRLRLAAQDRLRRGSLSANLIRTVVLDSDNFRQGLSRTLSHQRTDVLLAPEVLEKRLDELYGRYPTVLLAAARDLEAVLERDFSVTDAIVPFLYFKGFHALQTHRVAHQLWLDGQADDALLLQNRSSVLYGVDIHPAARIGTGIMLDHATGLVIGETAVVEDDVSLFHNVTLGSTGKEPGDRHPKVRAGAMIGAGATVLGNIEIGAGARVGAGAVVLRDVPPRATVAGNPARIVRSVLAGPGLQHRLDRPDDDLSREPIRQSLTGGDGWSERVPA